MNLFEDLSSQDRRGSRSNHVFKSSFQFVLFVSKFGVYHFQPTLEKEVTLNLIGLLSYCYDLILMCVFFICFTFHKYRPREGFIKFIHYYDHLA